MKEGILYLIGDFTYKIGYFIFLRKFFYLIFLKKENYCDTDFQLQLPCLAKFLGFVLLSKILFKNPEIPIFHERFEA